MEHQGKTPFNLDTLTTSQSSRIATPVKQLVPGDSYGVTRLQNPVEVNVSTRREQMIKFRPILPDVKHIPAPVNATAGNPCTVQRSRTFSKKNIKLSQIVAHLHHTQQIPLKQPDLAIQPVQLPSNQPYKTVVGNPAMASQTKSISNKSREEVQQFTELQNSSEVTPVQSPVSKVSVPKGTYLEATSKQQLLPMSQPVGSFKCNDLSTSPSRLPHLLSKQTPFGSPASIQKTQIATSEPQVANQKKLAENIMQALQRALESNEGHPIKKFAAALKKNSPIKNLAPQFRNAVVSRESTLQTTQPPTNITQTILMQQAKPSTISGANFIQTTSGSTASPNEPVLSTTTIKNDTVFEQVNINKKRKLSSPTDLAFQPVVKNKKTEGAVNTIYKEADTSNTSKDQPITQQTESQTVPPKHFKKDDFKITSELKEFMKNVDRNVLECNICFKKLQNPKSLNCLHSFCLACLEDWVEAKRQLTCPTCAKSYPIPEGGLQKLTPNTFINNLLETMEQFSKKDELKCVCGNEEETKHYCQDCKQYLCSACSDHHKNFRLFANHKLHSVDDIRSMSSAQIASLHPPMCSIHNESLKFFCSVCCVPLCIHCTMSDHKEWEGNHKTISLSEAFQTFKESSVVLEKAANQLKHKLHDGIKTVTQNATDLEESKNTSLRDIDNHVQEIIEKISKRIREDGERMKNVVMRTYRDRKTVLDVQMNELDTTVSDINTKLSFLNQLLESDEATAVQSSGSIINELKDRINKSAKPQPTPAGKIKFLKNNVSLQQCKVGKVGITQKKKERKEQ